MTRQSNWIACAVVFRAACLCIIASAAVYAFAPIECLAQQFEVPEDQWKRGYHGLTMICRSLELDVQSDLATWQNTRADNSLLIMLGSLRGRSPVDLGEYLEKGGAALLASDRNDSRTASTFGIGFSAGVQAASTRDVFRNHLDCPIVTDRVASHPVLRGVESIVTNRPGRLFGHIPSETSFQRVRSIASLPRLRPRTTSRNFLATVENRAGGRALCMADQSVFSNQMLMHGDNALLAIRTLDWLRDGKPRKTLIVVNGQITDPFDPSSIDMVLPPPTRQEVLEALKTLPPDVLIDFGNVVATVVEDEGMVNEFASAVMRRLPVRTFNQILIALGTMTLFLVAGLTWIARGSTLASPSKFGKTNKRGGRGSLFQSASERKLAAETAVDGFCTRVAGRSLTDWKDFPAGITITDTTDVANAMERSMNRINQRLRSQLPWYWTRKRLISIEQDVQHWEQLHAAGSLSYDSLEVPK